MPEYFTLVQRHGTPSHKLAGMGLERTREFLLSMPRVGETLQWDLLVFWVADKAVGGRMFATLDPEPGGRYVGSFAVPPAIYNDLLEIEGIHPAPYLARAHWVAVERWDVLPERELHEHLRRAYERVLGKLPRSTQRLLEGSDREYRAAVREKRAAAKAASSARK
ncbi:MAG: MmcQ/YjbR family DNA-binding protein [Janthinobacterium lividum]